MIRSTKSMIYDFIKQKTAEGVNQVDTQTIAEAMELQRTNASSILNELVREGKIVKTNTRPVYYSIPLSEKSDVFSNLIGYKNSLGNVIRLAKAAIHYPNQSLNMLIVGEQGVGKSSLANLIYEYAKQDGIVPYQKELVKINIRHFIHNLDELKKHLFMKENQSGIKNLFEEAAGSYLFIDNVHLLDGSSLSRLIHFIETGEIIYLDGTKSEKLRLTLILSIDKQSSYDLLQSLITKIPVTLELPSLKERSLDEKLELIHSLFIEEAISTDYDIEIEPEVLYALLLLESNMNIKFLMSSIKVAVAEAYLRSYDQNINVIKIVLQDFDKKVQDGMLNYRSYKEKLEALIPSSFEFLYSKKGSIDGIDLIHKDFYEFLNQSVLKLQKDKSNKEAIDSLINEEINSLIKTYKDDITQAEINVEQLSKIVDIRIINIVRDFIEESSRLLDIYYPSSVIYGLSLHIQGMLKNQKGMEYLNEEKIKEVKEKHAQAYQLALKLRDKIEPMFKRKISDDETIILSMFLIVEDEKESSSYPQVLIAMHGNSSASSIANVINDLVKRNNTYAYDMSLHSSTEQSYKELRDLIEEIDQGSGVIVLYDMGSLKTILERIASEIDVDIRVVYIPLTLIGLEASRKASMDSDIDNVYNNLLFGLKRELNYVQSNQMALITLCHTGEGGAKEIKEYLHKNYRDDIKIYAFAISDRKQLAKEVQKVKRFYDIKAFVGTYDPKMFGIPFIPVSQIFELEQESLDALLLSNMEAKDLDYESMIEFLNEENGTDLEKLKKSLPDTIEDMDIQFGLNLDQKVGLFLHIGALIHRIQNKMKIPGNENLVWYLDFKKEEMKQIRDALKKVETQFEIIVPDAEIANIYEMLKKEQEI